MQPRIKTRIALKPANISARLGRLAGKHTANEAGSSFQSGDNIPFTVERVFVILRWLVVGLGLLLQLYLAGDVKNPENMWRAFQFTALVAIGNGVFILLRYHYRQPNGNIPISLFDAAVTCLAIGISGGIYSPFLVLIYLIVVEASFDFNSSNAMTLTAGVGAMFIAATMFISHIIWNELHLTIVISEVMAMFVFVSVGSSMTRALQQQREVARREKALSAQLNHQVKALSALNRLSERLNASLELEELMQKTVESLPQALDVDACVAFLTGRDQFQQLTISASWSGVDAAYEPLPNDSRGGIQAGALVLSNADLETVVIEGKPLRIVQDNGQEAILVVPLHWDDRDGGGLSILRQNGPAFEESDQELLGALGRQMSLLIKNAYLYELERQNVQRLQELEQLKSDFLSVVSHELRTPLTSIKASTILLLSQPPEELSATQSTLIKNVERNTDRLNSLVNDLLDMAKLQNGRLKLSLHSVNFSEVLQDVVATIRPLTDRKNQTLLVEIPPKLATVSGDRRRLEQVVTNLLSNANRYTQNGGTIKLEAREESQNIVVCVSDNGPGIAEKEQEKIFERFYRAHNTQGSKIGTGLGLSIARSLVELHGGRIWVESTPGEGSAFYFNLPVTVPITSTKKRSLTAVRD